MADVNLVKKAVGQLALTGDDATQKAMLGFLYALASADTDDDQLVALNALRGSLNALNHVNFPDDFTRTGVAAAAATDLTTGELAQIRLAAARQFIKLVDKAPLQARRDQLSTRYDVLIGGSADEYRTAVRAATLHVDALMPAGNAISPANFITFKTMMAEEWVCRGLLSGEADAVLDAITSADNTDDNLKVAIPHDDAKAHIKDAVHGALESAQIDKARIRSAAAARIAINAVKAGTLNEDLKALASQQTIGNLQQKLIQKFSVLQAKAQLITAEHMSVIKAAAAERHVQLSLAWAKPSQIDVFVTAYNLSHATSDECDTFYDAIGNAKLITAEQRRSLGPDNVPGIKRDMAHRCFELAIEAENGNPASIVRLNHIANAANADAIRTSLEDHSITDPAAKLAPIMTALNGHTDDESILTDTQAENLRSCAAAKIISAVMHAINSLPPGGATDAINAVLESDGSAADIRTKFEAQKIYFGNFEIGQANLTDDQATDLFRQLKVHAKKLAMDHALAQIQGLASAQISNLLLKSRDQLKTELQNPPFFIPEKIRELLGDNDIAKLQHKAAMRQVRQKRASVWERRQQESAQLAIEISDPEKALAARGGVTQSDWIKIIEAADYPAVNKDSITLENNAKKLEAKVPGTDVVLTRELDDANSKITFSRKGGGNLEKKVDDMVKIIVADFQRRYGDDVNLENITLEIGAIGWKRSGGIEEDSAMREMFVRKAEAHFGRVDYNTGDEIAATFRMGTP